MGKLQKLDSRIQAILHNGIRAKHRTVFVMVGNKGQDQVPIMHQILNSLFNKGRLNVLWCYKKELSFSTHRKKNLKLLNKKRKAGLTSDATIFEQFICSTDIRWCYYHETHKILGQTFDMCVLQDFETLTPNTLARTIETVAGGGLIVFLLKSMESLQQLCTMAMDVHARYRTDAHQDVVCRFNERFLLSLANNTRCLLLDDRWRVLPLSQKVLHSIQITKSGDGSAQTVTEWQQELQKLKVSLSEDGSPFAPLVKLCVTLDQARSLVHFCASVSASSQTTLGPHSSTNYTQSLLGAIGSSTCNATTSSSAIVLVTAARGRGKSAALGLGLAAAFECGLPNLYVTAPSPENLTTLMQFTVRGLVAFGYEEHLDYEITRSTDPDFHQAVIRIDVYRQRHRQSLVYSQPWELANQMSAGSQQVDLICVDEAAAIPLPLVRTLITGPRLVFMASTVNGYEGTGRSLSLKLIKQLRQECKLSDTTVRLQPQPIVPNTTTVQPAVVAPNDQSVRLGKSFRSADTSRVLYEVTLNEAIRYANGDPVEAWLVELLCLDCGSSLLSDVSTDSSAYYPPVDQCQLYYVNRDTLFAYHKSTEVFLHRLMALYVASHYKNSPNDLQLLSDAPAHHIFCLLAPYDPDSGKVPEILCVLQVCLEGRINKDRVMRSLTRGLRPSGDLIPWTISQQFCDPQFGELSGARVVRIATHPEYQNLGYGSRALHLLHEYYSGKVKLDLSTITRTLDVTASKTDEAPTDDGDSADDVMHTESSEDEELIDTIDPDTDSHLSDRQTEESRIETSGLLTEQFQRRGPASLPPLLSRLSERPPESLQYVGVSFGATPSLLRFWKRLGYLPVYLRQTLNELTGEFTCIMIRPLESHESDGSTHSRLLAYHFDFIQRFMCLLPVCFRYLDAAYALEFIHHKTTRHQVGKELNVSDVRAIFTPIDMERLRCYSRSLVDFHVVSDLIPRLARLWFDRRLAEVRLNKTQQVILLGLGLQHKTVEWLASEFSRLLGDSSGKSTGAEVSEDHTAVVLSHNRECKLSSISGTSTMISHSLTPRGLLGSTKSSAAVIGVSGNIGWTKRIRGLLFVVVRELVRAVDVIIGTDTELAVGTTQPTTLVASSIGGDFRVSLDHEVDGASETEIPGDHESIMEADADPEGDNTDEVVLSESELERRSAVVRQLMADALTGGDGGSGAGGTLNSYRVHGSVADWSKAIVGHGSDLASLNVKLPATTNVGESGSGKMVKKTKRRRNDAKVMGVAKKKQKVKKVKQTKYSKHHE